MVEGGGAGGSEPISGQNPTSSCEASGDRLRFTVELRPGETTIVSWKKLLKEATSSKPNGPGPPVSFPSSEAHQQLVSPPLPSPPAMVSSKQVTENDVKDSHAQAGPNRLSNVIEKIERIYAGNGSSEEEDVFLDGVPDDDEYDTDDSFIDDTELDDYFQVDNSSIKHDGFFVNRGKLERIEPVATSDQQPKKRRRKDGTKGRNGINDVHNPNKQLKMGNKGRKSIERNTGILSHRVTAPNMLTARVPSDPSPSNAGELLKKRTADTQIAMNPSEISSGEGMRQNKDTDQQRTRILTSQVHNSKLKDSEVQEPSAQGSNDKNLHVSESRSGKQLNKADELDQTVQWKEKGGIVGGFDLNVPPSASIGREPQITKVPLMPRKEGSNVRSRISMLDKAIRELEKIVAESRPPSTEVQDPDNSSQAVKRRLPQDIKQKLAKVARLAQASYGKIPKDVTNRLMSIVGHLMQLRTLKRNLKIMANLGLSAKQEKDDRLQKIKQEVADMVRQWIPYMKSKLEHQTASSDDFQEAGLEEKKALKQKYSMDDALENKICDLYDLYVERLEEDSGPPVRRLYEELASLWPSGIMDAQGIKRAIYKAKDRRKALHNRRKDKEKIRKRKVLAQKIDNAHAVNMNPSLQIHEKLPFVSQNHSLPLMGKPVSSATVSQGPSYIPVVSNASNMGKLKREKTKGSPSNSSVQAMPFDVLPKKKSSTDTGEAQLDAEEKHKQQKAAIKPNLASAGSENPS